MRSGGAAFVRRCAAARADQALAIAIGGILARLLGVV
jgi:hypothetical protein